MASLDFAPRKPLLFSLPIFGPVLRELAHGSPDYPLYLLVLVLSLWGIAFVTFGLPGLYLPALALVPVMFILLVMLTRG